MLPLRWRSHGTWRVIVHLRPNKTIVRECRGAGLGRRVRRVRRASSSSSQYASALYFIGAATGAVSCGSAQNMRTDSAKAKVSRQLATGRRRSALEPRRGIVRWWQAPRRRPLAKELHRPRGLNERRDTPTDRKGRQGVRTTTGRGHNGDKESKARARARTRTEQEQEQEQEQGARSKSGSKEKEQEQEE